MSSINGITDEALKNFTGGYFKAQQCFLSDSPQIEEGRIKEILLKEDGVLVITPLRGKKFQTEMTDYKVSGLIKDYIFLEAFQEGKFLRLFFPPQKQVVTQ